MYKLRLVTIWSLNDKISDLKVDISTLEKKFDSLNVVMILINPYEHGVGLVISGDIISHGSPTENCKDIVFNLFWHYLNTHLGEDELSIFFEFEKNLLMVLSTPLLGFSEMRKK